MSDGREERDGQAARIEQEKQDDRADRLDPYENGEWDPERVDS